MKVRIKENSRWAQLAAKRLHSPKVAIVFGDTIHLHNTTREEFLRDPHWVCHELKHVAQYKEHGFAGFLLKYVVESIRRGYHHNRFEVEARQQEQNVQLLENVEFI